ncbi:MAG: hypothetical protein C0404_05185 [Verrucomicrobia bacterium]|nr:hypothetical protein [Verrucomicrobiota bacterium]
MKNRWTIKGMMMMLAVLLGVPAIPSQAAVPQPLCVFYGQALDDYGWPYLRDAEVVLKVNGKEFSRYTVQGMISPGVNFILRVAIDSGNGTAYSDQAVPTGSSIDIVVIANGTTRTVMEGVSLPKVGKPGDITYCNVTAGTDADGDGLSDEWERWIVSFSSYDSVTSIWNVVGSDDFDGDGASNEAEYRAGTDPAWDQDRFAMDNLQKVSGDLWYCEILSVPGKAYTVHETDNLFHQWEMQPFSLTQLGTPSTGYVYGDGLFMRFYFHMDSPTNGFYRLATR